MKRTLKILLWSSFFINFSAGLLGPIYAVFVEDIGGDLLTAGVAYAFFSIATGAVIFFIGKFTDKVKHQENFLIAGRVLAVIGTAGYLSVKNSETLFFIQTLLGFSQALVTPAYDSLYSKSLQKGKFASQWGYWSSLIYVTMGVSAILGGFIARRYGFKVLFEIMTALAFLSFISTLLLIKKPSKK